MEKQIRRAVFLAIVSVSCLSFGACNSARNDQRETTMAADVTHGQQTKETTGQIESTQDSPTIPTDEESTQDVLDEAIKQLEELNDILKN